MAAGNHIILGSALGCLVAAAAACPPAQANQRSLDAYKDPAVKAAIARITQQAIWAQVRHQAPPTQPELPALAAPCGVFVTITHEGETRGCWGTVEPRQATLTEELGTNAVKALSFDYRHRQIRPRELAGLVAHVSIVGEPSPMSSIDALQPRRFGLFLTSPGKGAALLPGEAATASWALATCRRKAGLRPRERASLYRFETAVVGPIPLTLPPT